MRAARLTSSARLMNCLRQSSKSSTSACLITVRYVGRASSIVRHQFISCRLNDRGGSSMPTSSTLTFERRPYATRVTSKLWTVTVSWLSTISKSVTRLIVRFRSDLRDAENACPTRGSMINAVKLSVAAGC
jgi:hypothetical protein